MRTYQNTVNQVPTERSRPPIRQQSAVVNWESVAEIETLLKEKCTSLPTSFSRNLFLPNLISSSVRSAKCDGTRLKSGEFYTPNAQPLDDPIITSEECVDLDRFLLYYAASSDERVAGVADDSTIKEKANLVAAQPADDLDPYNTSNFARYVDSPTNPFIIVNSLKDIDNYKVDPAKNGIVNDNKLNNNKNDDYISMDTMENNSAIHSGYTSTCTSPTNVFSAEGSPYNEYFLLNGTEVADDYPLNNGFFESLDPIIKDDQQLSVVYTPDNSNGIPYGDIPALNNSNNYCENTKRNNFAPLMLNLKDVFNTDEINTPNIIDTIIDASEQPFITVKQEESPFFTNANLEDFTPCPSTSPPTLTSDNTDSFLTAISDSPLTSTAKKRGKPRKRRHNSEDSADDDDLNDETYVPRSSHAIRRKPRSSRAVAAKQIIYEEISEDEDYKPPLKFTITSEDVSNRLSPSFESDEAVRVSKRGRPPKHSRSISSDDYSLLDPEEAKYREMRDRNNEASRKSRYKRKQKELQISDDCEHMEMENIKLKAQVEELQKTVERYRENLMKVMLNKK